MAIIDPGTFLEISSTEVARLVREAGPQVCVFAVNGTRRWFMLEHGDGHGDAGQAYIQAAGRRYLELCRMCFDHGLDTVLSPVFGSSHFERDGDYMRKIGVEGLALLATHPEYLAFYKKHEVRVRFYGDYRKQLAGTPYEHLCDLFDDVTARTSGHHRHRLFYGVFANDATQSIAELAVRHFQNTGRIPTRAELVEIYYGEHVEPATMFIGFSKLRVYDYPLLNLGQENLYFTVAPSLYLSEAQLRSILYDHIYLRTIDGLDYAELSEQNFRLMKNFYYINRETTLGTGVLHGGVWYPNTRNPEQLHIAKSDMHKSRPIDNSGLPANSKGRVSEEQIPGDWTSHT